MLKHSKYQQVLYSGLISVAMHDPTLDKEIMRISKIAGLKANCGLALMHLRGKNAGLIDEGVKVLAKEDLGK